MKQALFLAGATLAFAAAPAAAKPGHAGHGNHAQHSAMQHAQACPPGLAKKNNGCLPPGQAKKLGVGSRYVTDYGYRQYSYNQLPDYVRDRYYGDRPDYYDNYDYYYDQGSLYRVDPTTQIVQQIIQALIR